MPFDASRLHESKARMETHPVDLQSRGVKAFRAMSGERADRYMSDVVLPGLSPDLRRSEVTQSIVRERLSDAYGCLEIVLRYYAFVRRGQDREALGAIASQALQRTTSPDRFTEFLARPHARSLWENFVAICAETNRKPIEQLNRGVIAGFAELAQEIYRNDGVGSIAKWIANGVMSTDRLDEQFMRLVDTRGVGPKISSLLARDVVFLFGLEEQLDHRDRLFVQPIDRWLRLIAPYVVEESDLGASADWILAGKLSKYARRAGVSGIRFNMGTTQFGLREVRDPSYFDAAMRRIVGSEV